MAVKGKGKQVVTEGTPRNSSRSGSGSKRRKSGSGADAGPSSSSKRSRVQQFLDDVAGVDDDYEEEEEPESDDDDWGDGFVTEKIENANFKRTERSHPPPFKRAERSHPLPFLGHVKEEELSGDELEEFINKRYSSGVRYAGYGGSTQDYDDEDTMDGADGALKEPTIWRVKCMVGRERHTAFCFMQKFVDLQKFGTKVPIISAFSLDNVRGFVFVEAEKACDVTEACKGFCNVYASRTSFVPAAEVPSLLSSRAKPFEVAPGTWVRMKSGNYKGDLAQVIGADDARKRVMIKLIPRVDLQAISKKFGGAISLKEAAVPAPRLISSQELEFFGSHVETRRDRQTGDVFQVLDRLMFKDGFLFKRVALSSLICWGIQPTETELLKFSSSPSIKNSTEDLDWVSNIYGRKKRNVPREQEINTSSSKAKYSKASNLKASTSTENCDDDDSTFNRHELVLFGRKDFGVVISVEKDGFKILKGGPEGSLVTVRKQDIKKGCVDKMFTAVDHQKKLISVNDTVKVLEGPAQGKQGVVKHLYMGILFIYNESETENNGFFCAQCGSCENIKKRRELASSEENPIPMFSESPFLSSEQNEQRGNGRSYTSTREELFSIGQMLRIKKGPLKGYLCRVVRIFRNDVTVKLDSLLKIVSVQAEFLSVPTRRGDNSSGAASGPSGSQDTPFFEADNNSWDNGLTSLGSDTWQPFSSSTLPAQNAGGESEVDPWCKKTAPSADGDSDPWCNKTSSAVDVWNNSTTLKESSSDNAWDKQAGGGGLDAGGSSWGVAAANKENEKSDDWGEACKVVDLATGGDSDPWGSKVKEVDVREADTWGKTSVPPEKKLEDDSQGWGQPSKSSQDQEKCTYSKDANRDAAVGGTSVSRVGDDDSWVKCDLPPVAQDDAWGKSKEINNGSGNWNKANDLDKPKFGGGAGPSSWNKGEAVEEDNLNNSWSKPGGSFEGSRGFGRGRGRGRGRESGDSGGQNDQGSWKNSWGNGNSGGSSWSSDTLVDNETGNGGGFRGRGRGRGRDQYGRGRGRDNCWRNGDQSGSEFGRERSSGDTPNAGISQPWNGGEGTKSCDENQTSTWNSSEDKKLSGGEKNDSWASKTTKGQERQTDDWSTKVTSTAEAENNSDPWNTKAKDSSCSAGGKLENGASGEDRGADPWANKIDSDKGKEHEIDPWASKVSSTMGAYNSNDEKGDPWNNKGGDEKGGGWSKAGSSGGHQGSSWGKSSSSSGDQEPAWSKPKYGDDNAAVYDRGGFGRGNRGRGRFGDGGSSWNGGSNRNDESGGGRFGDGGRGRGRLGDGGSSWNGGSNKNDESGGRFGDGGRGRGRFGDGGSSWNGGSNRNDESGGGRFGDGGRGRGRGRFGRGDRGQGNNFGSGDRGGGGSWGSGRGNSDQGGGWSQSSSWNADKNGSTEGKQAFSKGNSSWGSEKNDDWGAPKPSGGDDQAGKNDGNNGWSQNKSSGSSVLGQWNAPGETTTGGSSSILGAPLSSTITGGGGSWGKNNEDGWNSSKGVGGSEGGSKKEVSWEKSEGIESQGGGGSSWDKADDGWNSKKDGNSGSGW